MYAMRCLFSLPRMTFKILISLVSKWHTSQKQPLWLLRRCFIPLDQSNYHQSSSSLTSQAIGAFSNKTPSQSPEQWKVATHGSCLLLLPGEAVISGYLKGIHNHVGLIKS